MARMMNIKPAMRYIGSVAAAQELGVSRSTIHKAVKTGTLVPDMRTPHGHARFRPETLEAFREDMASETLREVAHEPLPHGSIQQARLLAAMVQSLTTTSEVPEICKAAFGMVKQLVPNVHMGHVALHMPTDGDPWAVQVVAHEGYPADTAGTYRELGRSAGPFTTEEVVRTGRMVRIEAPRQPGREVRHGTAVFMRQLNVHTFLALPLMARGQCIGALVVLSHRAYAWSAAEIELLQAVADHVGATVSAAQLLTKRRRLLSGGCDLVMRALNLKGTMPAEAALQRLAEEYRRASAAVGVCLRGIGHDLLIGDERLLEHAAQAQKDGVPKLDFLDVAGLIQTVVASALDLPSGERAGLAALWPGRRSDLEAQHKLLTIFGGACVLVLSPSNQ